MTEPTPPTPQPAPLPERVQALLAAEFFDKPAPVDRCGECSFDQTTTILQRYTNGTARWVSFCPSCYSRADLGSADVSDRLATRALLAETAAALTAAQAREKGLRERMNYACLRLYSRAHAHREAGEFAVAQGYSAAADIAYEEYRAAFGENL